MVKFVRFLFIAILCIPLSGCPAQEVSSDAVYTFKNGDPNGTGKWFMGREIARVMGYQGMAWLERPDREEEEKTSLLMRNMDIQPTDTIADIGAGSGYHVFQMASLAKEGLVYAVDIQEEMLNAISRKQQQRGVSNVELVRGSEESTNLPGHSVDKVLMVDVYHEFSFPRELMESIRKALRPDGKLYLIEYRGEDPKVPIKKLHKMTEAQAVMELEAAGFVLEKNIDNLPRQHCMVFAKR
jgi:SAM-dependent methyltransferase